MPQQPQESRLLTGGIDTDSSLFAIAQGDVLNSVNLRSLLQRGQKAGTREWIAGNSEVTAVTTVLPAGTNTLLGKCVDDAAGKLYLFLHNSGGNHAIIALNSAAGTAVKIFDNACVTGGLGWTSTLFISCDVVDGLLIWCQGNTDQRYINLSNTYSSGSPITAAQLSLVCEPGMVPPTQSREDVVNGSKIIQFTPLQFAYRFTNEDGFTSVLSPYSDTAFPARSSDVASSTDSGNAVTVTIPTTQKVPANWKRVEIIARYLDSNVFYVIKRWDSAVSADVTAVGLHNATTTALELTEWTGSTLETLDAATAAKQFDLAPIEPQAQKLAANRNVLANFSEGYDTPTTVPAVTSVETDYVATNTPTATNTYDPFVLVVEMNDTRDWYFAIIIRDAINGINYLLPKECATGKFIFDNNTIPNATVQDFDVYAGVFNLPEQISAEQLYELKEQGDPVFTSNTTVTTAIETIRRNIVAEANGLGSLVHESSGGPAIFMFPYNVTGGSPASIEVEDTLTASDEEGPGGERRAYLPGMPYGRGVQYFDSVGRKSGVLPLESLDIPAYDFGTPEFVEKSAVTVPTTVSAGVIPDWAEHFAITQSRAGRAARFNFFYGGIIKALFKTGDGTIVYGDPDDLTTVPPGRTVYGVGVPIPTGFKYDYAPGDYMLIYNTLSLSFNSNQFKVLGTWSGHIVLEFSAGMDNLCAGFSKRISLDWSNHPLLGEMFLTDSSAVARKAACILVAGTSSSNDLYEIAAFGNITGSTGNKQFGNFYKTGNKTIDIYGDCHTHKRTSYAGGGLGLGMSPYEDGQSLLWVNDLGRSAPTDSVGQKNLVNAVRWSNARIPGAVINGYGSFDANDFKTVDITAGEITAMALTTRGTQDGGQLLVLCEHGSFAALIGQQQIAGADGKNAFTAAATVIGEFNSLRGQFGCQSPRSVVSHEGKVWWADVYKRAIIEFNESGAGNIGLFKTARLWDALLAAVTDPTQVSFGVDSFTGNLMVSLPTVSVDLDYLNGFSAGQQDYSNAVDGTVRTWLYDYVANRWVGGYTSGAEFARVGSEVYGWKNGKLWQEFSVGAGSYYNEAEDAILAVVFNAEQPYIKRPVTLKLLAETAPDLTVLKAGAGTASVQPYKDKEGLKTATVMRDRTGNGASNLSQWLAQSVQGRNLKGDTIVVMFKWTDGDNAIDLRNVILAFDVSSGQ